MSQFEPTPSLSYDQEEANKTMRIIMRKFFYPRNNTTDPEVLRGLIEKRGAEAFAKQFAEEFDGIDTLVVEAKDPAYLLHIAQTMCDGI